MPGRGRMAPMEATVTMEAPLPDYMNRYHRSRTKEDAFHIDIQALIEVSL